MDLFIFFALPFATLLLAIVFQKILRSPTLVALTFFAIYLIVAFVAFPTNLAEAIIAAIIYTIIAYITAYIVMIICRIKRRFCHNRNDESNCPINRSRCSCGNCHNEDDENMENNLLTISCRCGNSEQRNELLSIDSTCSANDIGNGNFNTRSLNRIENTQEDSLALNSNNQYANANATTNTIRTRPVALGNNIVNRNKISRRPYRKW